MTLSYLLEKPENLHYIVYIDRIVENLVAVQSGIGLVRGDNSEAAWVISDQKFDAKQLRPRSHPTRDLFAPSPQQSSSALRLTILRVLRNSQTSLLKFKGEYEIQEQKQKHQNDNNLADFQTALNYVKSQMNDDSAKLQNASKPPMIMPHAVLRLSSQISRD